MQELKNKKVAIYGGTFNPIHLGHLITGLDIIEKLNYDKVLYIPANIPSHKFFVDTVSKEDRLNMVKLSLKNCDNFIFSDIEIKRGGISYTIDTLEELKEKYDYNGRFGVVFGDDLVSGLHTWKEIDRINKIADLICLKRNHKDEIKTDYNIKFVNNRIIDISSTEIRERIKNNLTLDFFLKDTVIKYIFKKKLYRN